MSVATTRSGGRRTSRSEQRVFLTNTAIALLVATLGLVVAASLSLTTNAQVPVGTGRAHTAASANRDDTATRPNRNAALRAALTREVAAERAEQLAKTAEATDQAARDANSDGRQQELAKADQSTQASGAQIAQQLAAQRLQAAIAARQAAEAALNADQTTTDGSTADASASATGTGPLPTGTTGVMPVPSGVVGAGFGAVGHWGRYHTGLDFRAAYGTPIRAVLGGTVLFAGNSGDWAGNHVAVRHADGRTTMYSHMSRMATSAGQTVQAGQIIGYVGETGRAFGAHLHFELYPVGVKYGDVYKAVDPVPWLRSIGVVTH